MKHITTTILCALLLAACDDSEAESCPSDMDDDELTEAVAKGWGNGVPPPGDCIIDPWTGIMACPQDSVHIVYIGQGGVVQTWSLRACTEQYADVISTYDERFAACLPE